MKLPAENSLPDFKNQDAEAHKRFTLYGTYLQMAIAISILILFAVRGEPSICFVSAIFSLILIVVFGTYSLGQAYDLEKGGDVDTRRSLLLLSILCAIQLCAFLPAHP